MSKHSFKYVIFCFFGFLVVGGSIAWFILLTQNRTVYTTPENFESAESFHEIDRIEGTIQEIDTAVSSENNRATTSRSLSIEEEARILTKRFQQARGKLTPLSSAQVSETLLQAMRSGDSVMLNSAAGELRDRGKRGDGSAIVAIRSAIENALPSEQSYLAREVLGQIATGNALEALLDLFNASEHNKKLGSKELQISILAAISQVNTYRDEAVSRQELSAPLEEYFDVMPKDDVQLVDAVSLSIGRIGASAGIERLIQSIERAELDGALSSQVVQRVINGLHQSNNPEALQPLQARLIQDRELKYKTTRIVGDALASMNGPGATDVLLQWAASAKGAETRRQALAWFRQQVHDEASLNVLLEAGIRYKFRDQETQKSIRELARQMDID